MVIIISKSRSNLGCQGPSPDEAHRLASKEHPTVSEQQATRGRLMRGGGQTRVVPRICLPPTQLSGKLGLCSMVLYKLQIGPKTWRAQQRSARCATHQQLGRSS